MKLRSIFAITTLALTTATCSDSESPTGPEAVDLEREEFGALRFGSTVTHGNDSGPGSLRQALENASGNGWIKRIRIPRHVGVIEIESALVYSGSQPLIVDGSGTVIDGAACGCSALVSEGGADLTLRRLTVRNAAMQGIEVRVPADAQGVVALRLSRVTVENNGLHGVLVEDQVENSPASLLFRIENSRIVGNGFGGVSDFDGIRLNEGGAGNVTAHFRGSYFEGNGADGVEIDEVGAGSVFFGVRRSSFHDNGPHDPDDLEDGFDIDEADDGGIVGTFVNTRVHRNSDGGIDLDEAGEGDVSVSLFNVRADENDQDAVKFVEEDGGDLTVEAVRLVVSRVADEDGTEFEENGEGDLDVRILSSEFSGNSDDGLLLQESDGGQIDLRVVGSEFAENGGDGLKAEEEGEGDHDAHLAASSFTDNAEKGINLDEDGGGEISVDLVSIVSEGNGEADDTD